MDSVADVMNSTCGCVTTDRARLRTVLDEALRPGFADALAESHPDLFADQAVFLTRGHLASMQATIDAVESVVRTPAYAARVLADEDPVTQFDAGTAGVFFGYDFHLTDGAPQLIEVNTNAGGALLQLALAAAQHPCCEPVRESFAPPLPLDRVESDIGAMFENELRLAGHAGPLRHVAIVDEAWESQFLRPEFELFVALFARRGVHATIGAPSDLRLEAGRVHLRDEPTPIDLVYLRSTDFRLQSESHAVLRRAHVEGAVVVTPSPRTHRLYADKRNLALLTDPATLDALAVPASTRETLLHTIPRTVEVHEDARDALWADRDALFFKPCDGFGSRAAYRGEKVTRKVFESIVTGERPYVAQALVRPSERVVARDGKLAPMKVDVRAFAYDGRLQFVAARLYQGQTTNLRTKGGGLSAVVVEARDEASPAADVAGGEALADDQRTS